MGLYQKLPPLLGSLNIFDSSSDFVYELKNASTLKLHKHRETHAHKHTKKTEMCGWLPLK